MENKINSSEAKSGKMLEPEHQLKDVIPNIALMLKRSALNYSDRIAFQAREKDKYIGISWEKFYKNIVNISYNLRRYGFQKGDRIVIFSENRLEMLEFELSIMASGGIAVPIFFNYSKQTAELLIEHTNAKFLALGGNSQLEKISSDIPLNHIFTFDSFDLLDKSVLKEHNNISPFNDLLRDFDDGGFTLNFEARPDDICLCMYTSGTMGHQKCVQLTHKNILSQQAALSILWNLNENDRFLSYLRWHHSFGGIFEIFTALYNGAAISLESSLGSNPEVIFENWKLVKPTVFFSVPIIYQSLVDMVLDDKEAEKEFFHPELKFVFTAAAPLPQRISDEFEKRKIPVIEGWGLTETSPCCTLTNPELKRETGVVGLPIPGVKVKVEDDGEILVKGPNVMVGYYNNDKANEGIFTDDGWFCTGDIGEITDIGLRIITRKDRIFKLLNAEKIIPTKIEENITKKCHYISYAYVAGNGKKYPVALLFPNKNLLNKQFDSFDMEFEKCSCPKSLKDLSNCLQNCLVDVNCGIKQKFSRISAAMLIDDNLSVENKTLTPSLKLAPNNVKDVYRAHIEKLYDKEIKVSEQVYIISLNNSDV
jgi:long-subunit acyl-CoA synthetase (AMP-forming)